VSDIDEIRAALDTGIVVETSGSTSRPKRVKLSDAALRASAEATADALGTGGWVLALPLSYIAGIMVVVRSLVSGTPLIDARHEPFNARSFMDIIQKLPAGTWFTSIVPAQLVRLLDFAENDEHARDALRRFERILVGGQAIPAGVVDRALALGIRIMRTYGSAETAGGVVYDGHPIGDTVVRIDADGRIAISTSSLADGYDGDDALTSDNFIVDDGRRWWRTSDLGSFENGVLTVEGRADDVIVTGGIKVSLGDIDRVLGAAGIDAIATWFPDDTWGQVPAVVSTTDIDRTQIRTLIERELSREARPNRFVTVTDFPRLSSGKIDRRALRELAAAAES
jgi:O-succinylbenzoic acid--CoA ligase